MALARNAGNHYFFQPECDAVTNTAGTRNGQVFFNTKGYGGFTGCSDRDISAGYGAGRYVRSQKN